MVPVPPAAFRLRDDSAERLGRAVAATARVLGVYQRNQIKKLYQNVQAGETISRQKRRIADIGAIAVVVIVRDYFLSLLPGFRFSKHRQTLLSLGLPMFCFGFAHDHLFCIEIRKDGF